MNVPVRELRLKLSEYVRRARAGESFVVTNRGWPIARLSRDPRDADDGTLREPRGAYIAVPGDIPVEEERVGVRALKAGLPRALQLVAGGTEITVTDREAPVARL